MALAFIREQKNGTECENRIKIGIAKLKASFALQSACERRRKSTVVVVICAHSSAKQEQWSCREKLNTVRRFMQKGSKISTFAVLGKCDLHNRKSFVQ